MGHLAKLRADIHQCKAEQIATSPPQRIANIHMIHRKADAPDAVHRAGLDQARAGHRASVLTALKDVEDALVALQGDRERLARLRAAATAADNAALLARQRYASGLVDFQTVLETQRSQLSAQDSVASAGADLAGDHVRLYKALGGGWQPDAASADAATRPTS